MSYQEQPDEDQGEIKGPKCFKCSRLGQVVKNCLHNKRNSVNIAENIDNSDSQPFESEDVALSSRSMII